MLTMSDYWVAEVEKFRLTTRENDRVLVDAPPDSMAAKYNGEDGVVTGFLGDGWILASINGSALRFRPDELKML